MPRTSDRSLSVLSSVRLAPPDGGRGCHCVAAGGGGADVRAYSSDSVNGGRWRGDSKVNGHGCACGEPPPRDAPADIRVLVVDDHPSVRATLTELLSDEDGLTVVGECEDGSQVVEAAERLHPD